MSDDQDLVALVNSGAHQLEVATAYARAIQRDNAVNWAAVNRAIIDRWSQSRLLAIKKLAWTLVGESKP